MYICTWLASANKRRDADVGSDGREESVITRSHGQTVPLSRRSCIPCTVRLPAASLCIPRYIYRRRMCRRHSSNRIDPCRAPHPPTRTYHRILPARRRELWGRGVDAKLISSAPGPTPENVLLTQPLSSNLAMPLHDKLPPGVEIARSERTYDINCGRGPRRAGGAADFPRGRKRTPQPRPLPRDISAIVLEPPRLYPRRYHSSESS